jgi:sec-independent protein translocase protein TatC
MPGRSPAEPVPPVPANSIPSNDVRIETGAMPLLTHLEELRKRVFLSIIAVAAGAMAAFFFAPRLIELLTRPVGTLVFLAPAEAFVVQLKVALIAGAVLAAPVVSYQFWRFVRPALRPREAHYIAWAVAVSTLFFLGGLAFAYFVMVPFAMRFLLGFESSRLQAMISLQNYIETVGGFLLAAGVIFQMPVVVFFLARLGIVTTRLLWRSQRIAVVACFVVGAVLSPPDIVSQTLMSVPLLVLYELSILGAWLARPRPARDRATG